MSASADQDGTDLKGRTVVITGASDGVGAAVARGLSGSGAHLILVGRSPEKTRAVAADVGAEAGLVADFSDLGDVRRLAEEIRARTETIDVLVNNAGGLFDPSLATKDGYEPNTQINHLAPFLLTNLLHDRLAADGGALVLNTSSIGNLVGRVRPEHMLEPGRPGSGGAAYSTSKLMNILFTRGIASRWEQEGIVSVAIHPGAVASRFGRDTKAVGLLYRTPLRKVFLISPQTAAKPYLDLIRGGADRSLNGVYFHRKRRNGPTNPQARDRGVTDELWTASAAAVGL